MGESPQSQEFEQQESEHKKLNTFGYCCINGMKCIPLFSTWNGPGNFCKVQNHLKRSPIEKFLQINEPFQI